MIQLIDKPGQMRELRSEWRSLLQKLSNLGNYLVFVNAGVGVCSLFLIVIAVITIQIIIDWFLDLDIKIRSVLFVLDLCIFSYILYKKVICQFIKRKNEEELALLVEKYFPIFKDRLISSVQLMNIEPKTAGISSALLKTLLKETEQIAAQSDFSIIVDTKPLIKLASVSAITLFAFIFLCVRYHEIAVPLIKRFALSSEEVPRKTKIEIITGDKIIGRGDSVIISAKASGIIPSEGDLVVIYDSGRTAKYPFKKETHSNDIFSRELENVQDSFKYRVKIFDAISKYHFVKVVPRPQTAYVECVEEFPRYTDLPPAERKPEDLGLLAGSILRLKITATKDLKSALIHLAGLETNITGFVNPANRKEVSASIKIPTNKLEGFSISLIDDFGISSKDQTLYRIDILPDKPPSVKIIYPERREELYTKLARALIGFEASDDFGLSAVRLRYKIEYNDKTVENFIDFDLGNARQTSIRRHYEWNLSTLVPPPVEGSTIEYWLEVIDNNDETGTGIGYSERFLAKVVSEAEKRADLMNRVAEYIGNLENVANEQEKLSKSLGEIILEKVKK